MEERRMEKSNGIEVPLLEQGQKKEDRVIKSEKPRVGAPQS